MVRSTLPTAEKSKKAKKADKHAVVDIFDAAAVTTATTLASIAASVPVVSISSAAAAPAAAPATSSDKSKKIRKPRTYPAEAIAANSSTGDNAAAAAATTSSAAAPPAAIPSPASQAAANKAAAAAAKAAAKAAAATAAAEAKAAAAAANAAAKAAAATAAAAANPSGIVRGLVRSANFEVDMSKMTADDEQLSMLTNANHKTAFGALQEVRKVFPRDVLGLTKKDHNRWYMYCTKHKETGCKFSAGVYKSTSGQVRITKSSCNLVHNHPDLGVEVVYDPNVVTQEEIEEKAEKIEYLFEQFIEFYKEKADWKGAVECLLKGDFSGVFPGRKLDHWGGHTLRAMFVRLLRKAHPEAAPPPPLRNRKPKGEPKEKRPRGRPRKDAVYGGSSSSSSNALIGVSNGSSSSSSSSSTGGGSSGADSASACNHNIVVAAAAAATPMELPTDAAAIPASPVEVGAKKVGKATAKGGKKAAAPVSAASADETFAAEREEEQRTAGLLW